MTDIPRTPPFDLSAVPEPLQPPVRHAWETFAEGLARAGLACPELPPETARVWATSRFVAQACGADPALLLDLLESGDLQRIYAAGELEARVWRFVGKAADDAALDRALRQHRRREMLRIAWRDLAGLASLDETLRDTTDVAEHFTDATLDWHYRRLVERHGVPRSREGEAQRLVVLGMGKLGGGELNFSSDIDLIFAYPEEGETDGERALDNFQFFLRLGQRLIKSLDAMTADGFVFRVDMRLRPFGDAGPLVMSFSGLEDYYQAHGREWERYAMIKARVIAGDRAEGKALHALLRPFVYRRYLDYGAFASLREMKAMINRESVRKGRIGNVKLGAGGIREIEFIGQAFQLIRGGRDPHLQVRAIRTVLARLVERELLPAFVEQQLQTAYAFLRRTENHLQMWADQQTHALPLEEEARLRLAWSMGFDDWDGFFKVLDRHMRHVHEHFSQVFGAPQTGEDEGEAPAGEHQLTALWEGGLGSEAAMAALTEAGFEDTAEALRLIDELHQERVVKTLTSTGRKRLDQLMPLLIGAAGGTEFPALALERTLRLIRTIAKRSVYLALLVESPLALSQLVQLCAESPWIAEHLTRHPLLLDELLDPRSLYAPPDRQGLGEELAEELAQIDPDDMEQLMDRLRQFKQVQVLKVAAADVMDVLPLMKVSDQLTWIAEAVLNEVLAIAWRQLLKRHGHPCCEVDGERRQAGFAIIAYGKLGGIELGYGSDLDIVFLHDSAGEEQYTDGEKQIDNATFFARLAQRIIHILTALTPAGTLYEVDTRLRPSGASGLMVSSLTAFTRYQREEAWTWEHQALVRARPVAGDAHIHATFDAVRQEILARPRERDALRREVREMREKMWAEHRSREAGMFNLKKDPGGIADIEFMVQYEVLAYAHEYPALSVYTDNIRILEALAASGLMAADDAALLTDAYRAFRDRVHELTLQELPAVVPAEAFADYREQVQALWRAIMED